jgi:hypothetical protein
MNMSHITLEHIKVNELPPAWLKQLPATQTVTVIIIAENAEQQSYVLGQSDNVLNNQEAYLNDLQSQGIDIKRLRESIQQFKAGEVETVKLENLDAQLDEFIVDLEEPHLEATLMLSKITQAYCQTDESDLEKVEIYEKREKVIAETFF